MRETWRWFGEFDLIGLSEVAQTGATGIVSALHAIPYGEVWAREAIARRRAEIEAAGFTWDVVESLPVHEGIKRGTGDLERLFEAYCASLANLAHEGIKTVCYNFMPVLDWTRTDLNAPVPRGGTCLRFDASRMAAFEIHMLQQHGAADTYHQDAVRAGDVWYRGSSEADRAELLHAIMSGLPGAVDTYDIDALQRVCATYRGMTHDDLRANLARFLRAVIRTAEALGLRLCIHPDDPPRDILGLPRIASTEEDLGWILNAVDSPANGLTLCTGSLGARADNNVVQIARAFGPRIHFVHLRNVVTHGDGSFEESAHLDGDVDMVAVIREVLRAEGRRGEDLPLDRKSVV